ncbi:DUF3782 domain-containing protein [Phormidium sp. FACHB-1136]|uniref:DUF3782 domain-containing protein n=1 Tax=Phormidium sp. FACHB-1136 TaxID=2692848 RepID=UPI00168437B8|nr:DUF3782 domain-containing protein [Phormidium sp. FACHB-1136]MBD2427642.1 DUF3782 domain-containing protein [Phormidium sp. FACHB-1136]
MATPQPTYEDILRLFQETDRKFQETDRKFQETDRKFQETDRKFQETDRRFQETDLQLKETDRKLHAAIQENRRINQQVSKQIGELGGAWGRFVEDLVAPACERIFLDRGIPVDQVSQRVKRRRQGDTLEIDVLVVNQGHVLAVEVKSSLSVPDVKDFIVDLERFSVFFPEYAAMQLYGAVAGIGIESGADRYAYRQGLFVMAQSGDSVTLLNDSTFTPKTW